MKNQLYLNTGVLVATATPNIDTGAYSQSFSTTSSTTLYNIDAALNILASQVPPNDGILNTVGGLGVNIYSSDPTAGFDIYYDLNDKWDYGYVVLNQGTSNFDRLFTIDLANGSLEETGRVGQGIALIDIAIAIDSVFISSSSEIVDNSRPITIMPNPGNDYFTIHLDTLTSGYIEVTVFDLNGKVMLDSGRILSGLMDSQQYQLMSFLQVCIL